MYRGPLAQGVIVSFYQRLAWMMKYGFNGNLAFAAFTLLRLDKVQHGLRCNITPYLANIRTCGQFKALAGSICKYNDYRKGFEGQK